jgi:flagellar export protein FliJ
MTLRRKKVQKVLELREQKLTERAGVLVQAHEGRNTAASSATDAASQLAEATAYRSGLVTRPVTISSWIDAEQWLAHRNSQHARAQVDLEQAEIHLSRAHENVMAAHSDVRRMELLDKRLAQGETRKQMRLEQSTNDDHARRAFLNARRGDLD